MEEIINEKSMDKSKKLKDEGNTLFAQDKWPEALDSYKAALLFCPDEEADHRAVCHSNRGACFIMQVIHLFICVAVFRTFLQSYSNNFFADT